jgi:hypothetical protein
MPRMNAIADPLATLWERTQAKFARAVAAVGDAGRIAAIGLMSPELRCNIIRWLRPLENIVRKLLLAEAARLAAAPPDKTLAHVVTVPIHIQPEGEASTRAAAARAPRTAPQFDRTRPETWRAHFSFALPRDTHAVPERWAPRIRALWGPPPAPPPPLPPALGASRERDPALRLASRFEALRRVLHNPAPHARRLAELLRRLTRRFPEIVHRYALAACGSDRDTADPRLRVDIFTELFGQKLAFGDSS